MTDIKNQLKVAGVSSPWRLHKTDGKRHETPKKRPSPFRRAGKRQPDQPEGEKETLYGEGGAQTAGTQDAEETEGQRHIDIIV